MTEYILLEANRLRSNEQQNNPGGNDEFNNIWTNNVSTSGINVKAGDIISVEGAAINSIGNEVESTMEFLGKTSGNEAIDNKATLKFNYYVNHTGRYTIPLPFRETAPYVRYGTSFGNPDFTSLETLRCRQVGNTFIGIQLPPIGTTTYEAEPVPEIASPYLRDLGGGNPPQNEGGYEVGNNLRLLTAAAVDTGIRINILEVEAIGNTDGYITKYETADMPVNQYTSDITNAQTYFIERKNANPNQETTLVLEPAPTSNRSVCGRVDMTPNGLRYWKPREDYINFCIVNFDGMNDGVDDAQAGENTLGEVPRGVDTYSLAESEIDLEIPTGFSTPQDVAKTLTNELTKPTILNRDNNTSPFIDIITFEDAIGKPREQPYNAGILLETPTYHPSSARLMSNANSKPPRFIRSNELVSADTNEESNAGKISAFYKNIYYEEPERIEGLQFFRQFRVKEQYNDPTNELWTGLNPQANGGDYANQNIGELGNVPRMMTRFLTHDSEFFKGEPNQNVLFSNNQRFYPLVTNIYYRKETIERIAAGFRKAEKYRGRQDLRPTGPIVDDVINQNNYAVALDVGVYADGISVPGTLMDVNDATYATNPIVVLPGGKPYQRNKYLNQLSDTATGTAFRTTTTAIDSVAGLAVGASFNRDGTFGNGQELPTLWVASRWRDEFRKDRIESISAAWEDFMNSNNFATQFETYAFTGTNSANYNYTFGNPITIDGETIPYETYIKWSADANVAIVPVFPVPTDPAMVPANGNVNSEPFIAFLCFDYLDETLHGTFPFPWQADADLAKQGEYIGLDTSFTRNKAVYVANFQSTTTELMMVGANNPQIQFNEQISRFQIGGLSTPLYQGNPFLSQYPQEFPDPVDDPETEIFTNAKIGGITRAKVKNIPRNATNNFTALNLQDRNPYNTRQEGDTIIDAVSGVAIADITLALGNGTSVNLSEVDTSIATQTFRNSLLNKMGFELTQLLPPLGNRQARFVNALLNDPIEDTLNTQINDVVQPFTTNALVSAEQIQAVALNQSSLPIYGLGLALNSRFASADVSTDFLTAKNLPSKLDFPYMMVYTNLGIEMKYQGGVDSHSKLPCLAFISRNYSAGDFFYNVGDNYNVIVSRDFILTDITTDIRLPDGSRPRLSPHSCVIYKITKPATTIPPVLTEEEQEGNKKPATKK